MTLYLDEKIGLTERERNFAMHIITKAVVALRESKISLERYESGEDGYESSDPMRERGIGYAYANRNAALNIAGGSLCDLFGGMGLDTISALENLAKRDRDKVHTSCSIIVEEFYEELVKCWNAMKVRVHETNTTAGKRYGLAFADSGKVLYSATAKWKTAKGAENHAVKIGYELVK